jgi:PKD repeat protein
MYRETVGRTMARDYRGVAVSLLVLAVLAIQGTPLPAVHAPAAPVGTSHGRISAATAPAPPSAHPGVLNLSWWNITGDSARHPAARLSGSMSYDTQDGYTVLFGGEYFNSTVFREIVLNDTWTFLNGTWTNITNDSRPQPSPRYGAMIADDQEDGCIVLFGGNGPHGSYFNDTWEFRGGTWTNVTRSRAPPGRFWGSMSWDAQTGQVILFGGNTRLSSYTNDTWAFVGGSWSLQSPTVAPPARDDQAQVDDPSVSGVLMFGGQNSSYLNDSWSYSSGSWSSIATPVAPDFRVGAGMAYDAAIQSVVVYGGYPENTYPFDTWIFANQTWSRYSLSGSPPQSTIWNQMAYDAADREVVMFNGALGSGPGSTWALRSGGSPPPPPPLQASSAVHPLWGSAPLLVTFNASASAGVPPYHYAWTFGDRQGSALGNTTTTYTAAGTYTVNLSVSDAEPAYVNSTWTVHVNGSAGPGPLGVVASVTPTQGVAPLTVYANASASGGVPAYGYGWHFGDGNTSALGNTTETYTTPGTYPVSLNVTDSTGAYLDRFWNVTVLPRPPPALSVSIAAAPARVTVNGTVDFTSTPVGGVPPYTYFWSFGNGHTAGVPSPTERYTATGDFAVFLWLNDTFGQSVRAETNVTVIANSTGHSNPGNPGTSSSSSGLPVWGWAVIALIVVGAVLLVLFVGRRRKASPPPPGPAPP